MQQNRIDHNELKNSQPTAKVLKRSKLTLVNINKASEGTRLSV